LTKLTNALIETRAKAGAQERARLAREVHDGVAQDLAALAYQLDELATSPGVALEERREIRRLRSDLTETLNRLRSAIFELRNPATDLISDVQNYLAGIDAAGIHATLHCDHAAIAISNTTAVELRSIAFEALSNVVRHAQAANVEVTFESLPGHFQMTIKDDGVGNANAREFSYGLEIMRERAELIGAECTIESPESGGTVVTIKLPFS